MISAENQGSGVVRITYAAAVDAAALTATDFSVEPAGDPGVTITQIDVTVIEVEHTLVIAPGSTENYVGTAAGFATNDQVAIQ